MATARAMCRCKRRSRVARSCALSTAFLARGLAGPRASRSSMPRHRHTASERCRSCELKRAMVKCAHTLHCTQRGSHATRRHRRPRTRQRRHRHRRYSRPLTRLCHPASSRPPIHQHRLRQHQHMRRHIHHRDIPQQLGHRRPNQRLPRPRLAAQYRLPPPARLSSCIIMVCASLPSSATMTEVPMEVPTEALTE